MQAYLNKKFLPLYRATLPVTDRGLMYGEGVFETMRAYNGVVFLFGKHLARLFRSLKALGIKTKASKMEIGKAVYKLLRKNELKDAYVKIIVTPSTLAIYTLPYLPPKKEGVNLCISTSTLNEKSGIAGHKTLNYLNNLLSRREAERKGCYDAILLNTRGHIAETSSANIFLVKNKKIYTPPKKTGILPGVTREEVIRLARKDLKIPVKETFMGKSALYDADEIFVTNSLVEVLPVVGEGPITGNLRRAYTDAVKKYCDS